MRKRRDHSILQYIGFNPRPPWLSAGYALVSIEGTAILEVRPSLLATTLVLQAHHRVSDEDATARAAIERRWKFALGINVDQRLDLSAMTCTCPAGHTSQSVPKWS